METETISELERRCVLCYSGGWSSSSGLHEQVWARYRAGDQSITDAVRRMRDSAEAARDALLTGDLKALAAVLTENREAARRLHPQVVTKHMDELFAAGADAGAVGAKACGAGGGGCLLFLCAEGRQTDVEDALRAHGGNMISFAFAPPIGETTAASAR